MLVHFRRGADLLHLVVEGVRVKSLEGEVASKLGEVTLGEGGADDVITRGGHWNQRNMTIYLKRRRGEGDVDRYNISLLTYLENGFSFRSNKHLLHALRVD